MIDLAQLAFSYDEGDFRLCVDGLSVERGERVAVIGPSGSGKTTLLHLVAGILTPQCGTVRVAGTDLAQLGDAARRDFRITRLGLVFQEFELVEYLNVLDNFLLPFRLGAALRLTGEVRRRAEDLAARLGLADKLRRYPGRLSQGERQRVAIGRALIARPVLLLADEPTGNLDPVNTDRVLDCLLSGAGDRDVTLVAVVHDHGLLGRFDRVIDLEKVTSQPGVEDEDAATAEGAKP